MVSNEPEPLAVFADADKFIEEKEGSITIGITPNKPETSYGYIYFTNEPFRSNSHEIKVVESFKEKPNEKIAEEYLADGRYLWNACMFGAQFMKSQYELYAKNTFDFPTRVQGLAPLNIT